MHAMDLPDRLLHLRTCNDYSLFDAKLAYDIAFINLARIANSLDEAKLTESGVYDRRTFEEAVGAVWQIAGRQH
jgi:hypothetical protein